MKEEYIALSDTVRSGKVWINEINQFDRENLGVRDIAGRLSAMLRDYGDEFVDQLSAQEIVDAPQRFYVKYHYVGNLLEIIGMIAVKLSDGEISSLCVDPKYRNKGIGKRLVKYALRAIRDNGRSRKALVYVQKENLIALRLFASLGFVATDEIDTAKVLHKTLE